MWSKLGKDASVLMEAVSPSLVAFGPSATRSRLGRSLLMHKSLAGLLEAERLGALSWEDGGEGEGTHPVHLLLHAGGN